MVMEVPRVGPHQTPSKLLLPGLKHYPLLFICVCLLFCMSGLLVCDQILVTMCLF